MSTPELKTIIEKASAYVQKTWPLYSFVTSNPLSGYEQHPFFDAAGQAKRILGARVYPEASFFRKAYRNGDIEKAEISRSLRESGFNESPEYYLDQLENHREKEIINQDHHLDRLTVKWISAFMDEGLAEWSMPGKDLGFYKAWRQLAIYDRELRIPGNMSLPETAEEAVSGLLESFGKDDRLKIVIAHLAALPGWTGYIKHRIESGSAWQQYAPVTLEDYLAVRLNIARALNRPLLPEANQALQSSPIEKIQYTWLRAWESSWQKAIMKTLSLTNKEEIKDHEAEPDAQLVFCIDTRSEAIRRHIEAQGNYETFGYAGFFGIAMDYADPKTGLSRKSCPPIVNSAYTVRETHDAGKAGEFERFGKYNEISRFFSYFQKRMKNMLPSTFGYVEGSGVSYGLALLGRTLFPGFSYKASKGLHRGHEHICSPEMSKPGHGNENEVIQSLPLSERAGIVKSAFDLLGWKRFAPLVIFAGHGSHTANNPFASSLDCGACAASPGRHNARMLARLANMEDVREVLAEQHGIRIPETTWFIGAEHNTTTDRIELFDKDLPASHRQCIATVKSDLEKACHSATAQRLQIPKGSARAAEEKAGNWAETRPEWGLAGNAGFIIGPRARTKNIDLGGRCFLHSYQWEHDPEGKALEAIMQGPMVVTQWINNHYYFSTVDSDKFGSGSKITQNITGMFGVVQGNGGDLKSGLPLQSLRLTDTEMYHQPLRLSVIIEAPIERVSGILERNEQLKKLLDNEWIYLLVTDPVKGNAFSRYIKDLEWQPQKKVSDNFNRPVPKMQMAEEIA